MRTQRIIGAVNWKYAVGEVVLIVVGILVALAISDWNDRRVARIEERALLAEVQTALGTDIALLEADLEVFSDAAHKMQRLLDLLSSPSHNEPNLEQLFGAVYGFRTTNLNTYAYETLKSHGLQSIANSDLRAGIARVYDHHYQRLQEEHGIETEITLTVLRPYFLEHFRDLHIYRTATPIDFEAVANDPYFRNILNYRIDVLRFNQLDSYPKAISEMRAVLAELDAYLSHST